VVRAFPNQQLWDLLHVAIMKARMDFDSCNGNASPTMNLDIQQERVMPIAIVGMSAKLPGEAKNLDKFWSMCAAGRDAWSPIPGGRWNQDAFHHPDSGRNGSVSNLPLSHVVGTDSF
jgi:hypothetical protein